MDPYIENVINRGTGQLRKAADMAHQWQSNASSHGADAFGDARQGVADAAIEKNFVDSSGDFAAQQLSNAFGNAQGQRNWERDFGRGKLDQMLKFADPLYRSGSNQQSLNQQSATLAYEDFLRQQGYPKEQIDWMMSILSGTPHGSTTTTTEPDSSLFAKILGGAGTIASLF
jgi:hypothetical protein